MERFFIDTADVKYIKRLIDKFVDGPDPMLLAGITTNPNAFKKIGQLRIDEWKETVRVLASLVTKIRGDDLGVVYVQTPYSLMPLPEVLSYAKMISAFGDGYTRIGMKIPPYQFILKHVEELTKILDINVTGISDVGTALHASSFNPRYISVIPGRMEEAGIDAREQVNYLMTSNLGGTEVISGSMRTVDGLNWVIRSGTVPTIGERVWDLLADDLGQLDNFNRIPHYDLLGFSPRITETSRYLSNVFFRQMDECGAECYKDFKEIIKNFKESA